MQLTCTGLWSICTLQNCTRYIRADTRPCIYVARCETYFSRLQGQQIIEPNLATDMMPNYNSQLRT